MASLRRGIVIALADEQFERSAANTGGNISESHSISLPELGFILASIPSKIVFQSEISCSFLPRSCERSHFFSCDTPPSPFEGLTSTSCMIPFLTLRNTSAPSGRPVALVGGEKPFSLSRGLVDTTKPGVCSKIHSGLMISRTPFIISAPTSLPSSTSELISSGCSLPWTLEPALKGFALAFASSPYIFLNSPAMPISNHHLTCFLSCSSFGMSNKFPTGLLTLSTPFALIKPLAGLLKNSP